MSTNQRIDEPARQQLLEEIRKRAEEAELARIEAEELKLALESRNVNIRTEDAGTEPEATSQISDLRDELAEALLSKDLARATALYAELQELLPDDPVVEQFEQEILALQQRPEAQSVEQPVRDEQAVDTARLYESANESYQKELYDDALQKLDDLLSRDPENARALELRRAVEKAKKLAELIAAEERARNEQELLEAQQVQLPLPRTPETPSLQPAQQETAKPKAVQQQESSAASPSSPPPPAQEQIAKVGPARVFVKFLAARKWTLVLAGVVLFVAVQTAPLLYEKVRSILIPQRASLVVVPISYGGDTDGGLVYGLTDEFISRLAQHSDLEVFATATSFRRAATDVEGVRLASSVGAKFLLVLGMFSSPESVIVKATVKDFAQGKVVLEQSFPMHRRELAQIPTAAVPAIARALGVATKEGVAPSAHIPPGEVFEKYLEARRLLQTSEGEHLDSVQSILRNVVRLDSLFAEAFTLLGWVRVLSYELSRDTVPAQLEEAQAYLQRSVGLGAKGPELYRLWGVLEYYRNKHQDAVQRLQEAVLMAPSDAEALRRLALAQLRIGRTEQALEAARKAVRFDPGNAPSHWVLGLLNLLLGESEGALRELQSTLSLSRHGLNSGRQAYLAALIANNRHEQALDLAKQHVARYPESIEALYELGRMYQLAGKPKQLWAQALQRAKELSLQQIKRDPANPQVWSYLALTETRLGNFKQGMAACTKALSLAPHDYPTLYYATRVRALQGGRTPEAYAFLARAVYRRFSLPDLLDLDLLTLRRDPEFVRKITQ